MNSEFDLENKLADNNQEQPSIEKEIPVIEAKQEKNEEENLAREADLMESEMEDDNAEEFREKDGAERFFVKREIAEYIAGSLALKEGENTEERAKRFNFELKKNEGDGYVESGLGKGIPLSVREIGDDVSEKVFEEKNPVSSYAPLAFIQKKLGAEGQGKVEKIAKKMRDASLSPEQEDSQEYRAYMRAKLKGDQKTEAEFLPDPNIRIGIIDSEGKPAFKFEISSPWGLDSLDSIKKAPEIIEGKIKELSTLKGCFDFIVENVLMMEVGPEKINMKKQDRQINF